MNSRGGGGLVISLPLRSFVNDDDRAEGATSAQLEGEKRRRKGLKV